MRIDTGEHDQPDRTGIGGKRLSGAEAGSCAKRGDGDEARQQPATHRRSAVGMACGSRTRRRTAWFIARSLPESLNGVNAGQLIIMRRLITPVKR